MIAKYKCHFGVYLSKSMVLNIFHSAYYFLGLGPTYLLQISHICYTHSMLVYIERDPIRYWHTKGRITKMNSLNVKCFTACCIAFCLAVLLLYNDNVVFVNTPGRELSASSWPKKQKKKIDVTSNPAKHQLLKHDWMKSLGFLFP